MNKRLGLHFLVAVLSLIWAACSDSAYGQAAPRPPRSRGVQDATSGRSTGVPVPVGPYYALVIGNNNYQHLNKLQTAVQDAKDLAQMLRDRYGFKTTELYNATRDEILTALDDFRGLPEKSNLLIYYAGHGHKEVASDRAYWLPIDAEENHVSRWINAADITDGLRAIPARHILVIADSCFSGDLAARRDLPHDLKPVRAIEPSERDADLISALNLKSRHIFSSGGDEPVADVGSGGHSVFAAALLESLSDMRNNAFTGSNLWSDRVRPRVTGRSAQTPQYERIRDSDSDLGDFVFFRSGKSDLGNGGFAAEETTAGWGFLVDLKNAQVYDLKAEHINLGRDVPGIGNDISFANQLVSRRHLIINHNGSVDDLRSTNGTTINAQALPYGVPGKMVDSDILVLANVEPLQFREQRPSNALNVPPRAWAVFIDGQSRNYGYLTSAEYSLTLSNGKVSLADGAAPAAIVRLRWFQNKAEMLITRNEWRLLVTQKSQNSEYEKYVLKTDSWMPLVDLPLEFAKLTPDEKQIALEGPAWQLVLLEDLAQDSAAKPMKK